MTNWIFILKSLLPNQQCWVPGIHSVKVKQIFDSGVEGGSGCGSISLIVHGIDGKKLFGRDGSVGACVTLTHG